MSKSNKIQLFDEADVKAFDISSVTGKASLAATNIKVSGKFGHVHTGNASHSFDDFNKVVKDEDAVHETVTATLDAGIVATEGKISTEGINYLAHKATVATGIANETTRATGVTDGLTVDKNTMISARETQGTQLDQDIQSMIALRQSEVIDYATEGQTLVTNMSTEYQGYDALIGTRIDTLMSLDDPDFDKDTLLAIVNEYQNADAAQVAELATLQSDFDALKVRIEETIVAEAAGGGASASYDVTSYTLQYGGSTFLKLKLTEDGQALYDAAVAGDQYVLTYPDGSTQTMTIDGVSNYISGSSFYLNFTNTTQYHIFANNPLNFTKV